MTGIINALFHYPVKGLSAQPLDAVMLKANQGFPMDRMFGFARPGSGFDPQNPRPLPKSKFVVLAQQEGLAHLNTRYDEATQTLEIEKNHCKTAFDISTPQGSAAAAQFLADHLAFDSEQVPELYSATPHRFTDVSVVSPSLMNAVSLINLDSVAALSDKIGQRVDAARFRGNIIFSGLAPFSELDLVGQKIRIRDAILKVVRRTKRCPATQVNLGTGIRDLDIPVLLRDHFGHSDLGIYCEVLTGGRITPDDSLTIL